MKILMLSDANSPHTVKWAISLKKEGIQVHIFSLFSPTNSIKSQYDENQISIYFKDLDQTIKNRRTPHFSKIQYGLALPYLKKIISEIEPDLLHAHYASSYGVLAMLTRFKPFLLSVWGSDVYDFPSKSSLNKWLLKKVLLSADKVMSTSQAMARHIQHKIINKKIEITNFGIDTHQFAPLKKKDSILTIGTVKSFEAHNGINCFLNAVKILVHRYKITTIHILLVGSGTLWDNMKQMANALNINEFITFTGFVPHNKVVEYYQKMSIFVSVSTRESFGVSALEASACGLPIITSNVGGFAEVNRNNITGLMIPPNSPEKLAEALKKLIEDEDLRITLGKKGRERVIAKFDWNKNVNQMKKIYKNCMIQV